MMESGCSTHQGRVRSNNEDSFGCAPELGLFVLSDGMGGLDAGEVASRLAVDTVLAHCREAAANPSLPLIGDSIPGISPLSHRLASAVRMANAVIHHAAVQKNATQGMGATIVAAAFSDGRLSLAHVGDSRAYRLRNGHLEQLTQDHSFVGEQVRRGKMTEEQADASKLSNVLIRALGVDPSVEVEIAEELVLDTDTILLCSDGLTRELSDARIAEILAEKEDSQEAADSLVELANRAGGRDNITAIVLRPALQHAGAGGPIGILRKWLKSR